MEATVKGMFLHNVVEVIKQQKGPSGLDDLRKKLGKITYGSFTNYPLEEEIRLNEAALEVLFGEINLKNYRELGKLSFTVFTGSAFGKTLMSLFGTDVNKLAKTLQLLLMSVTTGIDINAESQSSSSLVVTLTGAPYPPEYYEGIWQGAMSYLQNQRLINQFTISTNAPLKNSYEYTLVWYEAA